VTKTKPAQPSSSAGLKPKPQASFNTKPQIYKRASFVGKIDPSVAEFLYHLNNHFALYDIHDDQVKRHILINSCTETAASLIKQYEQTHEGDFTSYDDLHLFTTTEQFKDNTKAERAAIHQCGTVLRFNSAFTHILIDLQSCPSDISSVLILTHSIESLLLISKTTIPRLLKLPCHLQLPRNKDALHTNKHTASR
jgi:hypothetical protein